LATDYAAAVEVRDAITSVAWELASIKGEIQTLYLKVGNESLSVLSLAEAVRHLTAEIIVLGELFSTRP